MKNRLMEKGEAEAFMSLAARTFVDEYKKITNQTAEDLAQSVMDDVEFWGVSSSYTGGQ